MLDAAEGGRTRLLSHGIHNVDGNGPLQPSSAGEGVARVCRVKAVILAREFTDQVLDAAASVQVQSERKSRGRLLLLRAPCLLAGRIGNGRSQGGRGLRCVLKDGKTLTKPQKY